MAMVTSPENLSTTNSGKKMRRQWKGYNRNNSIPGDTTWDTSYGGTNSNNPIPQDTKMVEDQVFRNPDCPVAIRYGSVSHALRAQMAEAGSGEAQLSMARELLVQVAAGDAMEESVEKIEENAMYWLIKAAEQGEREAVETVRSMAIEGRGVTDHNYVDVEDVVNMSCDDLIGNKIGHILFQQMAEGGDFVTGRQLERRANCEETIDEGWGDTKQRSRQKITKAELALAGCQYMQGKVPTIDEAIIHLDRSSILTKCITNTTIQNIVLVSGIMMIIKFLVTSLVKEAVYMAILMTMLGQIISIFKSSHLCQRYVKWSIICSSAISTLDCDTQNTEAAVHSVLHTSLKFVTCFAGLVIVSSHSAPSSSTFVISMLSFALFVSGASIEKSKIFVITIVIFSVTKSNICFQSFTEVDWIPQAYLQPDTLAVATLIPWSISGMFRQNGVSFILQLVFVSLLNLLVQHLQVGFSSYNYSSMALVICGLLASIKLSFQYKCYRKLVPCYLCFIFILTLVVSVPDTPLHPSSLSWPVYHQSCLNNPSLSSQVSCLHFNGVIVQWKGTIHQVKILERKSMIEDIANIPVIMQMINLLRLKFPDLQNLICLLGDPYADCTSPQRSSVSRVMCETRNGGSALPCHWERFASYKYSVQIKMTNKLFGDNQVVSLQLDHRYGEFCATVEEGRQVEFTGILSLSVGETVPTIVASKISYV